jgi:hypothetical protein
LVGSSHSAAIVQHSGLPDTERCLECHLADHRSGFMTSGLTELSCLAEGSAGI